LPTALAQQVLAGAKAMCKQAGIPLAGGHSINIKEPIFGLSVNGTVAIEHIKQNNTAKARQFIVTHKTNWCRRFSNSSKTWFVRRN
jgi:selenide,water dikinase